MSKNLKLIKKAQRGDETAFVEVIKEDELRLYNTALRIMGDEQDAADVLQETIIAAYKNIGKLKKAKYFYTWLYRILINQCNKYLREKDTYEVLDGDNYSSIADLEAFNSIEYLVKNLDEKYKIPILLFYQSGFSVKEIAVILGEPEGTVKSKLSRGRSMVKREYEK
ncbi:RNA polymerase sigma factor [Enterococcus gilvus]|uniref:RNA polymerase sigma factor n=1 Tax=Enterococcus gilvus TaxID=160453 RepID=UPI001C8B14D0|nr:sigma-70 family RNA polymerase sigma factor [Enterococcus gilvus]MBX8938920.1 sigma-70 family RNA polymerase sigma factor [Enterococcus gilvus]